MAICPHAISQRVPREHAYVQQGAAWYKTYAEKKMAEVDAMPYAWRRLVHEYGLTRVRTLRRQFKSAEKAAFSLMNLSEIDL